MGRGIVRGERERKGGLKRRKKVLRIGTGFPIRLFPFFVSGVDVRTGKGGREGGSADGAGSTVFSFSFFPFLVSLPTLPYLT